MNILKKYGYIGVFILLEAVLYFVFKPVSVESYIGKWTFLYFVVAAFLHGDIVRDIAYMKHPTMIHDRYATKKVNKMLPKEYQVEDDSVERKRNAGKLALLGVLHSVVFIALMYV